MASTAWPGKDRKKYIGSYTSRLDGPAKTTGAAKYSYDINLDRMLYARCLQSTEANAKVLAVDTSAAEAMKGVHGVLVEKNRQGNLPDVTYQGAIIATLAAETEEIAQEALSKIKVTYEVSPPLMDDSDVNNVSGRDSLKEEGDIEAGMAEADVISEGTYGIHAITHCCLESHGSVVEFRDGELYVWPSTQNVSGYSGGVRRAADLADDKIHVDCQYMGGGFGAKFGADRWGAIAVELAKMTDRPIKLLLERDQELKIAGHRPSGFSKVKVGVKKDGTITAWDAHAWGSGGGQRFSAPPQPYTFSAIPNIRTLGQGIKTNRGSTKAWRAPNHPQGCFISMSAMEDAAAAIGMDSLEFFKKNLHLTGALADTYAEELDICADLIGYKDKAHSRGDKTPGPIKRGIGMSIHNWGGAGHPSACDVTINPDGSVEARIGSQDLGTGTRTTITMVIADTLGLPMESVHLELGRNMYPKSGASGGSTTIGGTSASSRDASTQALNALLEKVAGDMGVSADKLEAWGGNIQEIGNPSNKMTWKKACQAMGQMAITKQGNKDTHDGNELTQAGVGGAQMADVSVDIETGVVTMNEYVGAQDIGLIIDRKTAESQIFGAYIMGITYSLFEEVIYDNTTGTMLNSDMEFYRLAGLGDIGKFKIHLMSGEKYESRGVIGLGEPPVISPGAAISNAIANAVGVRVGEAPFTPDRVLAALDKGGVI